MFGCLAGPVRQENDLSSGVLSHRTKNSLKNYFEIIIFTYDIKKDYYKSRVPNTSFRDIIAQDITRVFDVLRQFPLKHYNQTYFILLYMHL